MTLRNVVGTALGCLLGAVALSALAAAPAASVSLLTGKATATSDAGVRALNKGDAVYSGDIVSVGIDAYLDLKFADGGFILMRPNTRLEIEDYQYSGAATVQSTAPPPAPAVSFTQAQPAARASVAAAAGNCPSITFAGCKPGQTVVLEGLSFANGSTALLPRSKRVLDSLVSVLKAQPQIRLQIGGHTDDRGSPEGNTRLSEQRADAAKLYLMNHGIDGLRLTTRGYGASQPIATNSTEEGRTRNRRFELTLLAAAAVKTPVPAPVAPAPGSKPAGAVAAAENLEGQPERQASRAFFRLAKGGFRAVSGAIGKLNRDEYRVNTPTVTIGIRGTDYFAVVCDATCAYDPVVTSTISNGKSAEGGLLAGVYSGRISLGDPEVCNSEPDSGGTNPACTLVSAGEFVLVMPDGSAVVLPGAPRFLVVDPLADPAACGV